MAKKIKETNTKNGKEEILASSEKMLNWEKILGEQSEYVKKAIEPFLTVEFAGNTYDGDTYGKEFWESKYEKDPNSVKEHILNNYTVFDLFCVLTKNDGNNDNKVNLHDSFAKHLKPLGIEGGFDSEDEEWTLYKDNEKDYDASKKHHFKNMDIRFDIKSDKEHAETVLNWTRYPYHGESYDGQWYRYNVKGGIENAKIIVEDTITHFSKAQVDKNDIDLYLNNKTDIKAADLNIITAKKTGYVQGVCESVLAFNNNENKKIMTEATMTFLSKKLLSEMNVTKDMAQKFANPETYKALEQSVFAPKQEQQLEQTQSHGRSM